MRRLVFAAVALSTLAFTAAAQQLGVAPTFTGMMHDADAHGLRPILGIPGSAFLGDAVVGDLDKAWAAPNNDAAIVVRGEDTLLVTGLRSLTPLYHEHRLLERPSKVVWNRGGRVAAVYSGESNSLQKVTVQSAGMQTSPAEDLGYLGTINAIAVSASGVIAVGAADGVYLLREGSSPEVLTNQAVLSLTFYSEERLYASTNDSILSIELRDKSVQSVATDVPILALQASPKAAGLLGIDGTSQKVYIFDLNGAVRSEIAVERVPSTLTPIQGDSCFALNGIVAKEPLIVLNASLDPTLYFVPAVTPNVP